MKCKLCAVKMRHFNSHGTQMNRCFPIKCGTFIIVIKLIRCKLVFVGVCCRVQMVDSCLHSEPYTKEELCKFFELSVC